LEKVKKKLCSTVAITDLCKTNREHNGQWEYQLFCCLWVFIKLSFIYYQKILKDEKYDKNN